MKAMKLRAIDYVLAISFALALTMCGMMFPLWVWNFSKLMTCDFEPNYRCEVIHGVGLVVPPLSIFTAWVAGDSEEDR